MKSLSYANAMSLSLDKLTKTYEPLFHQNLVENKSPRCLMTKLLHILCKLVKSGAPH